ncbi:uncharacterized protein LY89DRAFT_243030 [Mollisia scopiformis]|uniref:Uncharacterized protein n=1 Tax=Mollisia scopiformis TaxID=149040 RepID=A0A194WTS6_MOLSC|nr:uncharacterized protein LY89DRAFT_243030 [Mollisia scopiformis]KUJ11355.1 hypothetical protein LY89DRAFT_243030 [Mollisia scopiformis]
MFGGWGNPAYLDSTGNAVVASIFSDGTIPYTVGTYAIMNPGGYLVSVDPKTSLPINGGQSFFADTSAELNDGTYPDYLDFENTYDDATGGDASGAWSINFAGPLPGGDGFLSGIGDPAYTVQLSNSGLQSGVARLCAVTTASSDGRGGLSFEDGQPLQIAGYTGAFGTGCTEVNMYAKAIDGGDLVPNTS